MGLDMTKGNPFQLIVRFMIPVIIGNLFQQLYNMVDTIIVGRFVGVQALAAVGEVGTIMFLILGTMQGITTGVTVLTAQRFGAGDMDGMRKSIGSAVWICAVASVVITLGSILSVDGLLRLLRTPGDIYRMSREYVIIIYAGILFTALYNLLSSILRAIGDSKVPLYFLILSALLNVGLDLFFIVVFSMGVKGAAYATVIAQGISGLLCLMYIFHKVPILHLTRTDWKPDGRDVGCQIRISIPMALQFTITAAGAMVVQAALNQLGSTVVAAYTAATKVEQFATQPLVGVGITMATYGAQNRGIHDFARIRRGARISMRMIIVYSLAVLGLLLVFLPQIVGLFITGESGEILGYVRTYILICGGCFIPLGMIFIYRNTLQGCGYSLIPTLGGVVELAARLGAAALAAYFHSYEGVCMANAGAWLLAGVFLWLSYLVLMRRAESRSISKPVINQQGA